LGSAEETPPRGGQIYALIPRKRGSSDKRRTIDEFIILYSKEKTGDNFRIKEESFRKFP